MQKILIHTEFIKLDALLKYAGLCETGGEAGRGRQSQRRSLHHAGQKMPRGRCGGAGWPEYRSRAGAVNASALT